jgi:hypothetical protein
MPSTQNAIKNHEYRSVPIPALAESPINPRRRLGLTLPSVWASIQHRDRSASFA